MHWKIARELNDKVGEGRACWSLGNAHTALGNHEKAIQFATRHLEISQEVNYLWNIKTIMKNSPPPPRELLFSSLILKILTTKFKET